MTFALLRNGTVLERHSTYAAALASAVRRKLAGRIMGGIEFCFGVEIIDESNQADLEKAIACAGE